MKKYFKMTVLGVLILVMNSTKVFACDPPTTHLFTGNAHDTLVIGEVISVDERHITIQSIEHVVSSHDSCGGWYREQIQSDTARIIKNEEMSHFDVGHHVLASLNQEYDVFIVANGIYQIELIELLDSMVWHVQAEDTLISALYSDFVNQQGRCYYSRLQIHPHINLFLLFGFCESFLAYFETTKINPVS
jgi:hypothetical protein